MPNALVFAAIVPKMLGARLMLDVHDLMTVNYMAKFNVKENDLPVKVLKLEQRLSAMFLPITCSARTIISGLSCRTLRSSGEEDHCADESPERGIVQARTTEQKRTDVFRIVYHGTIAHRLGIDLIVRAMARVVERIPAELWVYGAGDYLRRSARTVVSSWDLEEKVHFSRTFFPVEQIPEMVCGMDLGIIGNRRNLACDKYMLPVKLLEYVYLGIPVVAPRLERDCALLRRNHGSLLRARKRGANGRLQLWNFFQDGTNANAKRMRLPGFIRNYNPQLQADLYLHLMSHSEISMPRRAEHNA